MIHYVSENISIAILIMKIITINIKKLIQSRQNLSIKLQKYSMYFKAIKTIIGIAF